MSIGCPNPILNGLLHALYSSCAMLVCWQVLVHYERGGDSAPPGAARGAGARIGTPPWTSSPVRECACCGAYVTARESGGPPPAASEPARPQEGGDGNRGPTQIWLVLRCRPTWPTWIRRIEAFQRKWRRQKLTCPLPPLGPPDALHIGKGTRLLPARLPSPHDDIAPWRRIVADEVMAMDAAAERAQRHSLEGHCPAARRSLDPLVAVIAAITVAILRLT